MRALVALLVAAATVAPAHASHQNGHLPPPGPAKVRFARDFPRLADSEWGFALGGFGGIRRGAPLRHAPVIFVHGNNTDHADWYLVRDDFKAAGWTDQELWALSYNGLGSESGNTAVRDNAEGKAEHREMGGDGIGRIANNDRSGVPDLHAFISAVRGYTGSDRFSIVAHSLGVTVARKTLKVHPELRRDLVAFVGIAGGNHGTSLCPPGTEGNLYACDEVAAGTPWLEKLNGTSGSDETYAPARWLTVYDGSGVADGAFAGSYAQSPRLEGADNRQYPGTNHNLLRVDPAIVAEYREFIETAERALRPARERGGPARGSKLPATGGAGPRTAATGAALASAGALIVAATRRRSS